MNFQSGSKGVGPPLTKDARRRQQWRGSRLKKPQMKKSAIASVGKHAAICEAADGQPRSNPIGKARFGLGTKQS
jgi:hypothetical protein